MRTVLLIVGLFCCWLSNAQNKITGKWKPVFFNMDRIITGDVKADSVYLSDTLNVVFKNDKDPAASKELMQMMAGIMLEKMKATEQEFLATGVYIETNKKRNTAKQGTYTFDERAGLLTTILDNKTSRFTVSFKANRLILTGDLESRNGKKGLLIVEYEKL
jgi:hypothetical protein